MILSTGNKRTKLIVHFSHYKNMTEYASPITFCTIKTLRNRRIIGNGMAILNSKKDTFDKKIGRKVALTKALEESGLDKAARRNVWKSYFSIVKDKKIA